MRLTRGKKLALAIATAWTPLYVILFTGFIAFTFIGLSVEPSGEAPPTGMPLPLLVILPLHLITMALSMALLVVYVLHALQNTKLDQNTRNLWALLIFVGNFFAMPIYFYKYILPLQDDVG